MTQVVAVGSVETTKQMLITYEQDTEAIVNTMTRTKRRLDSVHHAPTVLIVDDYPAVGELARMILEAVGYDVWIAESAEAALQLLPEARWDALVTDLNMPGLSGMHLLRRRDPAVPAVLMSAQAPYGLILELRHLNAVWLQKPFSPSQLIDSVESAVARRFPAQAS
jgi:DNA-binding NtrC family response regulator